MSNYQLFQLDRYGNILPEDQEPKEEFEYRHINNKEACEWLREQEEIQLLEND